jgi:DNA-binding response OmpR family regulator
MRRVLLIDNDRPMNHAFSVRCLEEGTAVRIAETLCEAVRYLVESPVSVVVVDAGLIRLAPAEQAQVFEMVAPGVPVVVMVKANAPMEEHVRFEIEGFRVMAKPVDPGELLAKVEAVSGRTPASRDARARVRALCG